MPESYAQKLAPQLKGPIEDAAIVRPPHAMLLFLVAVVIAVAGFGVFDRRSLSVLIVLGVGFSLAGWLLIYGIAQAQEPKLATQMSLVLTELGAALYAMHELKPSRIARLIAEFDYAEIESFEWRKRFPSLADAEITLRDGRCFELEGFSTGRADSTVLFAELESRVEHRRVDA